MWLDEILLNLLTYLTDSAKLDWCFLNSPPEMQTSLKRAPRKQRQAETVSFVCLFVCLFHISVGVSLSIHSFIGFFNTYTHFGSSTL